MCRVKYRHLKYLFGLYILIASARLMAGDVQLESEQLGAVFESEQPDIVSDSETTDDVLGSEPAEETPESEPKDEVPESEPAEETQESEPTEEVTKEDQIEGMTEEEEDDESLATKINGAAVTAMENLTEGQARLSTNFLAAVARLDRIFGDERLLDDAETSTMTLGIGVEVSRFDGLSLKHKTRARISLPLTQNRLMLEFSQETEADDVENRSQIRSAYKDTTPDLGLRLNLLNPERIHLTASAGLRLGSPSQGYGRIRASRMFPLDPLTSIYIAQELKYYTEDRLSETSTVRLNRCVFDIWVIESLLSLRWRESESGCEPYLMFSFMHEHKAKRATRLDVGAAWPRRHTRANHAISCRVRGDDGWDESGCLEKSASE